MCLLPCHLSSLSHASLLLCIIICSVYYSVIESTHTVPLTIPKIAINIIRPQVILIKVFVRCMVSVNDLWVRRSMVKYRIIAIFPNKPSCLSPGELDLGHPCDSLFSGLVHLGINWNQLYYPQHKEAPATE